MIPLHTSTLTVLLLVSLTSAWAGHSRHPYCDGGQSVDGRYVVVPELIEQAKDKNKQTSYHWAYTWKDNRSGKSIRGKLHGLRSGKSSVFDPVHAHIFVAPDGETFALWNPNVLAPTSPSKAKWPDLTSAEARAWEGFSHRLTIYKKSGEIVKRLDLQDFLADDDWQWLYCYGRQVYWQPGYPPLTRDNAPRVGYALYEISPDYTVLETKIGATAEAARKAKERGILLPEPRAVRVDLTTGQFLDPTTTSTNPDKVPGRPFKGEPIAKGGRGRMKDYVPSLDPIRIEGKFLEKTEQK